MTDFAGRFLVNLMTYARLYACALMCCMPMKRWLKLSVGSLFVLTGSMLSVFIAAAAAVNTYFGTPADAIIIPASVIFFIAYHRTLKAGFYECLFVFMLVASLSVYPYHFTDFMDAVTNFSTSFGLFPMRLELLDNLFTLLIVVVFYFVRNRIAEFIKNLENLKLRKVFWIVPCFFSAGLLLLIPFDKSTLYDGTMK